MDLHAELGVLGIGLPAKFGGTGEEYPVTLGIACEELGAATLVYARQPGSNRSAGVSAFLVETDRPGVGTGEFTDMGQLPFGRGTLYLDDVFVPVENRRAASRTASANSRRSASMVG